MSYVFRRPINREIAEINEQDRHRRKTYVAPIVPSPYGGASKKRTRLPWHTFAPRYSYELFAHVGRHRHLWTVGTTPALARSKFGYPPIVEFMPDDKEHRRQIARKVNQLLVGKVNVYIDLTLTAGATSTTLTDPRIGYFSTIVPAMAQTANGAAAIVAGIWVSGVKTGSATINHASNAATDQSIRFNIIG